MSVSPSPRDLRIFAALLALFSGVVATLLVRRGVLAAPAGLGLALAGAALAAIGLCRPAAIRPVHRAWTAVTRPVGHAVALVVLAVVFVLVVTPMGLLLRCLGLDPLDRRFDPGAPTYWTLRRRPTSDDDYFRQF